MEAEKRTNRASVDSEVFELPHSSFVLEPDYADITKRGSLSNCIGEELLEEALTVITQLMLLFYLREKYNQCD